MDTVTSRGTAIVNFVQNSLLLLSEGEHGNQEEGLCASATSVALGLRLLTNTICTQAELLQIKQKAQKSGSVKSASSADDQVSVGGMGVKSLMTLLFDCIKASGGQLGGFTTEDDAEKECLFEAASSCALSLMKLHVFAASLTVDQWHTLGWTLLCPVQSIRQKLFNTLSISIQIYPLHAKFLAYPCLFATDDSLHARAEQTLGFAVQRRRRTHEELCSQAIGQSESQEKLRRLTESLMPESILPYLLHLLSYHPEFPTSTAIDNETDKRRMKNLVRSVSMLLQVLQNSLISESCNMSYLLKLLNTANRFYVDRHDPENAGLHFVTRMTVKLLHEQIKTSDNLQNHPGEVSLPADLYQRRALGEGDSQAGESSVAIMMLGAGTEEGFDIAESAIERALQIAGKGNKPQKAGPGKTHGMQALRSDATTAASRKRTAEHQDDAHANKRKPAERTRGAGILSPDKMTIPASSRLPEEAPTRVVPKRGAKEIVSYREPTESDREMLQWEEAAAQAKKPRRSSELSNNNSFRSSAGGERFSSGSTRSEQPERSERETGALAAWMANANSGLRMSTSPIASSKTARPSTVTSTKKSSGDSTGGGAGGGLGEGEEMEESFDPFSEEISLLDTRPSRSNSNTRARALQPKTNTNSSDKLPVDKNEKVSGVKKSKNKSVVVQEEIEEKEEELEEEVKSSKSKSSDKKGSGSTRATKKIEVIQTSPIAPRRTTRPLRA